MELREGPAAIDLLTLKTLSDIIEKAAGKEDRLRRRVPRPVRTTTWSSRSSRPCTKRTRSLSWAWRCSSGPSRRPLDDYISGAVDEREFLKRSEYFKRWGFDYNLYKPILDFARSGEATRGRAEPQAGRSRKRSRRAAWTPLRTKRRRTLPAEMDFSDEDYRGRLKQIFEQHRSPEERNSTFSSRPRCSGTRPWPGPSTNT